MVDDDGDDDAPCHAHVLACTSTQTMTYEVILHTHTHTRTHAHVHKLYVFIDVKVCTHACVGEKLLFMQIFCSPIRDGQQMPIARVALRRASEMPKGVCEAIAH